MDARDEKAAIKLFLLVQKLGENTVKITYDFRTWIIYDTFNDVICGVGKTLTEAIEDCAI